MTFSYAGIGSRETPDDVLNSMRSLAWELAKDGWHVRSGGADGADAAFHLGVLGIGKLVESYPMTIYIAWDGMNGHRHGDMKGSVVIPNAEFQQTLFEMAELYHPAWYRVGKKGRLLHARNGSIVLGEAALDPVQAVICWTKGGRFVGGTAQAMRIAKDYNIPIFNLATMDADDVREEMIKIKEGRR